MNMAADLLTALVIIAASIAVGAILEYIGHA
jgi:hypothetical protein